jgi:Ca-activated chloride channel family protein
MRTPTLSLVSLILAASIAVGAAPQEARREWSSNVIVPQSGAFHVDASAAAVQVQRVRANIEIVDGLATTTLDVVVANTSGRDAQAELLLPVPDGAVVCGFDFEGSGPKPSATLLPRSEARATYDSIVARLKDPALLEFAGDAVVRSSVFPVASGRTQTVRVRYEQLLPSSGGRWDYELPRSESLAARVPWEVALDVRSTRAIADVYSPTHDLLRVGCDAKHVQLRAHSGVALQPGALRVCVLLAQGAVTTTLFTSANTDGPGGWFLLLAGLGELPSNVALPPREVTLVIDRSGSMAGEKFDQAKSAARQVLEGLAFGEAVQIIDYSRDVERFAPAAVVKTRESLPALRAYLDGLTVGGGTNLDGALAAALSMPPTAGALPVVLFLTDGLPTDGETRETEIRRRIEAENPHKRRVFTFGVGNDVNAPLLDSLAVASRARATYVRPTEDIERAVGGVFEALSGPFLTDLAFRVMQADGSESTRLVRELYPQVLPDLYRGDRLVLVGRYLDAAPVRFEITGAHAGATSKWTLEHDFADARPRNGFVRRLWAMRRIAALEDELRRAGADPRALASLRGDARFGEIVKEMLALATRFGVLTDSTAFLALEGTALGNGDELLAAASHHGYANATCRTGIQGIAAQQNVDINREQTWLNVDNVLYDANGALLANPTVQTVQGRTFFRRGSRWVDGSLALATGELAPDRVVVFGSPEHAQLVEALRATGCVGQASLQGEILLRHGAETVLIQPAAN